MQTFIVNKQDSGQTLIKYLNRCMPECPKGLLFKQMKKKNITLNKSKANGNEKISAGDSIEIFMSDETIDKFKGSNKKDISEYVRAYEKFGVPAIVYEDEHIIIINKPVGMLSQKSNISDISANEWLIGYMIQNNETDEYKLTHFVPSVCNRLDRNTGGILLFGKSLFGVSELSKLLHDRSMSKFYRTIVCGKINEEKLLESYIEKDNKTNKVNIINTPRDGYSLIRTFIKPVRYSSINNITELDVELITGKTHQIRAHLASINHPIIGDDKYGLSSVNKHYKQIFSLNYQFLYSYKISFPDLKDYPEIANKTFTIDIQDEIDKFFKE